MGRNECVGGINMSLQKQLEKRFTGLEFSSHESDLYVLPGDNQMKAVMTFIRKKGWHPIISYSDVEGQDWHRKYFIDVPFANSRYWEQKGV